MGESPKDLAARARSGDARAQYLYAANLAGAGRRDEAETWLQAAASNGEPDALYTLATRELKSIDSVGKAVDLLSQAKGGAAAARLLSVLRAEGYGLAPDWDGAVAAVLDLAQQGDPASQRQIAGLLILDDAESPAAAALLDASAEADLVAVAVAAARRAEGRAWGSEDVAARAANRLAELRYPRAEYLKQRMTGAKVGAAPPPVNWEDVAVRLKTPAKAPLPGKRLLSEPDVQIFENVVPPELLEYVIAQAAPRLGPSLTVDSRDGSVRRDAYRTSLTATLGPVDQDLVIVAINRLIAAVAGVDHQNAEFLSVLRYAPGDEYRPHYDWLPPGADFDRGGQRVRTALLYLNDDYQGGETHFLIPDVKVRGKPGDLLVFSNALPDGSGDKASRHSGLPVTAGHKWLGSKWFRERPYRF
jgi:hypothetical protein